MAHLLETIPTHKRGAIKERQLSILGGIEEQIGDGIEGMRRRNRRLAANSSGLMSVHDEDVVRLRASMEPIDPRHRESRVHQRQPPIPRACSPTRCHLCSRSFGVVANREPTCPCKDAWSRPRCRNRARSPAFQPMPSFQFHALQSDAIRHSHRLNASVSYNVSPSHEMENGYQPDRYLLRHFDP